MPIKSKPLGDIDNDGWFEFATYLDFPSFDLDGMTPIPRGFEIVGRASLIVAEDAAPGDVVRFRTHLPSVPGAGFVLLASTAFSYRTGLWIDEWNTQLGSSTALSQTLHGTPFQGTLGAFGKETGSLVLPPNPALSGQTLYWRVVVPDPAQPTTFLTQSNLARTEIR